MAYSGLRELTEDDLELYEMLELEPPKSGLIEVDKDEIEIYQDLLDSEYKSLEKKILFGTDRFDDAELQKKLDEIKRKEKLLIGVKRMSRILSTLEQIRKGKADTRKRVATRFDALRRRREISKIRSRSGKGRVGDFFKSVGLKIKKFFSPDLENFPKGALKILKQYGDLPVIGISVLRTPLPNILNRVLSILTLGGIDRAKKNLKYEDLFHLYLVFNVEGGKLVIVEKNERPDVSLSVKTRLGALSMPVPIPRGAKYSINGMLLKTINDIGKRHFFQYRAFSWNCQDFIRNILNSNALLSPLLDKFIMLDVKKIVLDVPEFSLKLGNLATDTGALISKWLGRGRKKNINNMDADMCRLFLLQYTK